MDELNWKYSNAAGRWAGFGPYYAMFPVRFARLVVETMSVPKTGRILDPFCGRGTAPFVAQATGRASLGIDVNPVAWVFAKVKTSPEPNKEKLIDRLDDLYRKVGTYDKKPENEFQELAWSPDVLGFLNVARRELDWKKNKIDRTLMGFILVNLHGRSGDGFSNQMQKSRAMGPDYAVRWWKTKNLHPPEIDIRLYFRNRFDWRYRHGIIDQTQVAKIILQDSTEALSSLSAPAFAEADRCKAQIGYCEEPFDLLFTSPPYFGVTNYRQDSWIRLWMLGEGPPLPDWKKHETITRQESYRQMLNDVFCEANKLLKRYSTVWIRTDAREFTKNTTLQIIRKLWPNRKIFMRYDRPQKLTQTAHFGNMSAKPGEIDFLIPGKKNLPHLLSDWKHISER